MVVAVVAVLVVQTTVDDVVGMVAVRYGFVTAAGAVNMAGAIVNGMAAVGIGFIHVQTVLVVMAVVLVMQMAVVQIVNMTAVFDGGVAAAFTVYMFVIGVGFAIAHGFSFDGRLILFIIRLKSMIVNNLLFIIDFISI